MEKLKKFKEYDKLKDYYINKLVEFGEKTDKLKNMTIKELIKIIKDKKLVQLKEVKNKKRYGKIDSII